MTAIGALAVGIGAAFGAWLRWMLSHFLNGVFPRLPLGTLTANLVGGFLIGVALEFFGARAGLSPQLRLFAVTGFLGGLTTFSTLEKSSCLIFRFSTTTSMTQSASASQPRLSSKLPVRIIDAFFFV